MRTIQRKLKALEKAKDEILQAIMDKMDAVARRRNLDEVSILPYGNIYYRRGKEVPCKEIDRLDGLYLDYVHSGGFEALWSKQKGWH